MRGLTPVFIAAVFQRVEIVRQLSSLGANINAQDSDGFTAVNIAALEGYPNVVKVLCELGADLNTMSLAGSSPIIAAARNGSAEIIRTLASYKVDVTGISGGMITPLSMSVIKAQFEAAKTLLLLGAPVTVQDLREVKQGGNTRQLRADLQAWAADALVRHRVFLNTFLFGCTVHGQGTAVESEASHETPTPPCDLWNGLAVGESRPIRSVRRCATTGARVGTTGVMTRTTPTAVTTVTTITRTTNAILPMLEGLPGAHQLIADFAGVVVGQELRRTRAMGPAIAAIDWDAHDAPSSDSSSGDSESESEKLGRGV